MMSASRGLQTAVGHVVAHRVVEQDGLLGDHADLGPQRVEGDVPDVDAVDGDGPGGDVVEAGQEVEQGGFAGAARPHQGDDFAPGHVEVDVLQDGAAVLIGKGDLVIDDVLLDRRQVHGPQAVLDLRVPVHEAEDPHRGGQALLDDVLHGGQALDGLIEHEQRRQEGEEGARGGAGP